MSMQEDLGNESYKKILEQVQPRIWLAGRHNHNFKKTFDHKPTENGCLETEFYALKNFKSKGDFNIKIIDVKSSEANQNGFEYDSEWLAILRATDKYVSKENEVIENLPNLDDELNMDEELSFVKGAFKNGLEIPRNFSKSLPVRSTINYFDKDKPREKNYVNEQTRLFCKSMDIKDVNQELADPVSSSCFGCPILNWIIGLYSPKVKN